MYFLLDYKLMFVQYVHIPLGRLREGTLQGDEIMATNQPSLGDFDLEQQRMLTLANLATTLRVFPFDAARAEFSRLFNRAQLVLETDDLELARLLRVSRPTVGRWTRGESAPHPIGRKPVFMVLAKLAEGKLRIHASHQAVGAY